MQTPLKGYPTDYDDVCSGSHKNYDYLLKFLLVGDSDVGKNEILSLLDEGKQDSPFFTSQGVSCKTTKILLEGRWVKLQLWDTSGQGRFNTIIRSYSRGAQGILLVYDITNRYSFGGIDRWLKEIDAQAPGVPKILIGNRLHLEFRRAIPRAVAKAYADKNNMEYFEVSPLADFNIHESLTELSRLVLNRNGMQRFLKPNKALSLQDLCCHSIIKSLRTVYAIEQLPLPAALRITLRSFANSALLTASNTLPLPHRRQKHFRSPSDLTPSLSSPQLVRADKHGIGVKQSCKRFIAFCGASGHARRAARADSDDAALSRSEVNHRRNSRAPASSNDPLSSVTLRVPNETALSSVNRSVNQEPSRRHTVASVTDDSNDNRRSCELM